MSGPHFRIRRSGGGFHATPVTGFGWFILLAYTFTLILVLSAAMYVWVYSGQNWLIFALIMTVWMLAAIGGAVCLVKRLGFDDQS